MAMCKCKKSNPRNPRPCGCMSNPKGVKMYHTVVIPPVPFGQLGTQWHSRSTVTRGAFDTKAQAEEWAKKNLRGYPYSIQRKSRGYANPRRNPADIEYGSDDYRIGLFQGAVEKGKAPPPPSTSKELRSGYTAGARIAKAKPAAVQRALGVYGVTRDHARAGDELRDATLGTATTANPRKRRNPTVKEHSERAKERIKLIQSQLAWSNNQEDARERKRGVAQAMLVAGMAESDLWDGTPEKDHAYVERLDSMISGIGRELSRNPMSAAARKHLAHEKDEEKTFAAMMAKLPVGVTLKAGKHRIRKLSKGFVVVDGERLTEKQAAAKIHRGK